MRESVHSKDKKISWVAPEYILRKKTTDWYWWFGLAILLLVGVAFYLGNILFVFIIIIGGFSLLLHTQHTPKMCEYIATEKGIITEHRSYPYREIDAFFISEHKDKDKETLLLLQLKKITEQIVVIPLNEEALDEVREFLLDFIEEKEIARPVGQVFMEIIGF